MRGRAAASGQNTGDLRRVQTGNVGRADFVHHQNVRFVGRRNGFNTADLRQYATTHITQVGGALGQQRIFELRLLNSSRFDNRGPGSCRTFVVVQTLLDFAGQFRIFKHLLVGDEDFTDGLGLAALNQVFDVTAHFADGRVQTLALGRNRFALLRIIEGLQHLHMRRADGDARRGRHSRQHTARSRCINRFGDSSRRRRGLRLAGSRQWLDFFAKPLFYRGDQRRQRVGSDARLGNELQCLTTAHAQAEQLAQTLGRHRRLAGFQHAHTNFAFEFLGQLRQYLGWTGMQAVRVGQLNLLCRPFSRHFAAQRFKDDTAVGGMAQFMATPFDQQQAQALEQRLMRFTQAGKAEQAGQRLAQITNRFVWRHKRQARTLDGLLTVQPPQAVTQRKGFDLLQHRGKTVAHTVGLAQQTRAAPDQFFKIVGRYAEADHLRIERQLLRRALQQLEQVFRALRFT